MDGKCLVSLNQLSWVTETTSLSTLFNNSRLVASGYLFDYLSGSQVASSSSRLSLICSTTHAFHTFSLSTTTVAVSDINKKEFKRNTHHHTLSLTSKLKFHITMHSCAAPSFNKSPLNLTPYPITTSKGTNHFYLDPI